METRDSRVQRLDHLATLLIGGLFRILGRHFTEVQQVHDVLVVNERIVIRNDAVEFVKTSIPLLVAGAVAVDAVSPQERPNQRVESVDLLSWRVIKRCIVGFCGGTDDSRAGYDKQLQAELPHVNTKLPHDHARSRPGSVPLLVPNRSVSTPNCCKRLT